MQDHCFLLCKAWTWRTDCSLPHCNSPFYTWHIIWCDFMGLYAHQGLIAKMILIWSHWVKNKRGTNAHLFANKDSEDKTENLPYVFTSWNSFNILLVLLLNVLWSLLLRSFSQAMSLARSPQSMHGILQRGLQQLSWKGMSLMCFPFLALKPPTQCFASSLVSILLWWTERVPAREQNSCSSFWKCFFPSVRLLQALWKIRSCLVGD